MVIEFENMSYTPFHNACEANDINKIICLLREGYSIDETNKSGATGLMIAAMTGHTEIVKKLLLYGASDYITNHKAQKAIHYATDEEIIKILSKPRIYLEVKASYDEETNIFQVEIWYLYKKYHSKSYTFDTFKLLFDEVYDIFPKELPILIYNGIRLTPFNLDIIVKNTCVDHDNSVTISCRSSKKILPRIFSCFELC